MRERKAAPGVYWAEQTKISQAMREALAESIPSSITKKPIKCDVPLEKPPASLKDDPFLGVPPKH